MKSAAPTQARNPISFPYLDGILAISSRAKLLEDPDYLKDLRSASGTELRDDGPVVFAPLRLPP